MPSRKSNTWKKQLWLLAEFLIPNLIGFFFNSNLEPAISLCFLLWTLLMDEENQPEKDQKTKSWITYLILCAIALYLSLSLPSPTTNPQPRENQTSQYVIK